MIFCEYFTTGKYTKKSNFVEDKVENQGEIIQSDKHDTQKRTWLKCNMCKSDKHDIIEYKKNEITTVVALMSVFN